MSAVVKQQILRLNKNIMKRKNALMERKEPVLQKIVLQF